MAVINVMDNAGNKVSETELNDDIFSVPVKKSVLHQVVVAQAAGKRAGTTAVKGRSDVRGSGKKLYRQKGTGRARKGNKKSPLLRGGGVVFGPTQRSYDHNVPKKVKKLALKMALSSKLKDQEIVVIDDFKMEEIKTKTFCRVLSALDVSNALIVTQKKDDKLELSSRNLPGVKVLRSEGINVFDILKYNRLILTEESIKNIEGRLL